MNKYAALAFLLVFSCASKREVEGPQRWRAEPDGVRLELIEHFLNNQDPGRALQIIQVLRDEGKAMPTLDLFHAKALRQQGMLTEAESLLASAAKGMPKDARVPSERCILRADQGRVDEAIEACAAAVALNDRDAGAWNNLGYLLFSAGSDPTRAVASLEKAVQLNGMEPRYRTNLGIAHAAMGNPEAGLRTLRTVSSEADANYNIGVGLEHAGDKDAALLYYRASVRHNASHVSAQAAIARLNQE